MTISEKMKEKKLGSPHPMARVPMASVPMRSVTMARVPMAIVSVELKCPACCWDRGDGAHYKTPKLDGGLAMDLLRKHMAVHHPPAAHQPPPPVHH